MRSLLANYIYSGCGCEFGLKIALQQTYEYHDIAALSKTALSGSCLLLESAMWAGRGPDVWAEAKRLIQGRSGSAPL
jgi:hypothetical protein